MLEGEKLRRDINWLIEQVKCLWAKSSLETALSATEWSPNHTEATGNEYLVNTFVWFEGNVYKCIKNNEGISPLHPKYWVNLGPGYLLQEEQPDWDAEQGRTAIRNKPDIVNDKTYVHIQNTASNIWTVEHNLAKFPSITIVDSANNTVFGNVKHINTNRVSVVFTSAFSGKAFCN